MVVLMKTVWKGTFPNGSMIHIEKELDGDTFTVTNETTQTSDTMAPEQIIALMGQALKKVSA